MDPTALSWQALGLQALHFRLQADFKQAHTKKFPDQPRPEHASNALQTSSRPIQRDFLISPDLSMQAGTRCCCNTILSYHQSWVYTPCLAVSRSD
eukprot:1156086-Pelagomonas_calceolata.AAC.3